MSKRVEYTLESLRHQADHLRYETEQRLAQHPDMMTTLPDLFAHLTTVIAQAREDVAAFDACLKALRKEE